MPDEAHYSGLTLGEALARFTYHHVQANTRHISQDEAAFLLKAAQWLDEHGCSERVGPQNLFG